MISCLRRSLLSQQKAFNFFKRKKSKNWQNVKEKFQKQLKQSLKDMQPNEKQIQYLKYLCAFFGFTTLFYFARRQRRENISLQKMMQAISRSQTDSITVYDFSVSQRQRQSSSEDKSQDQYKKLAKSYTVYLNINGVSYYSNIKDIEIFIQEIKEIEEKKNFKIKILLEKKKTNYQLYKEYLVLAVHIGLPLLLPFLLYNSSMGKVFKNKVLGHLEGVARPNVHFNDIAGLGNAKIQVSQLVDFLKAPKKYKDIGAKVPKGALLSGPPGTGKTMLAKACAGQANVPFFSVSGSQFVQLFAGMGAHRVRQLFGSAKKQTPAIIFIDEIDAIGRKREDKFGGANDERANTLNQLLVQMDGFGTSEDIIVLAATNRKQMLDSALTRPGRFDRIVQIQLPDLKGRQQILQIYLNKIRLSAEQSLEEYAKRIATLTFGFSGADLANLCNEAAILAVRKQKGFVQPSDFQSASDRVLAGLEQSMVLSDLQKKKVAYHECGHAVTSWFLEGAAPLLKITIIPRSKGSLGFAQYLPNESSLATKQQLMDQLCVILGGRTAEEVFFNEVSNGAADDLQKVRNLARSIIVTYGMGEKYPNYAPVKTDGHNIFSEETNAEIDRQMMSLIQKSTKRTREIIEKYRDKIEGLAEGVLAKQTLNHKQIRQILGERPFESKQNYKQFIEGIKKDEERKVGMVV